MKKYWHSKLALLFILLILLITRIYYSPVITKQPLNIITWDALGYYLPLPGLFIYQDIKKMGWLEDLNNKYDLTGSIYQISNVKNGNGNVVMKYMVGISIMCLPFFLIAHVAAGLTGIEQDGITLPYQIAICAAALFYAGLGLWILRHVLLRYFSDAIVALTLILTALASNYIQYVSIDSGQSHGYIFTLYAIMLLLTIKWHEKPKAWIAFLIGMVAGLAIICRPTEIIILVIPLLYSAGNYTLKWNLVRNHNHHIWIAALGALTSASPQLVYWKYVTGSWFHVIGSKWVFLNPNWQVLFGWEKGWFIYTPIAIFMVAGIFFIKKNPFYKSILWFFILNTWIVIAWFDWRYGGSYSTRALVQSYAVMSIPLAASLSRGWNPKFKPFVLFVTIAMACINLFQIWQYNKTILHYYDMNRKYYQAIFLNPSPSPLEMSLLDTDEFLYTRNKYVVVNMIEIDSQFLINSSGPSEVTHFETSLRDLHGYDPVKEQWLLVSGRVKSSWGAFNSWLITKVDYNDNESKDTAVRLQNGISKNNEWNKIQYYFRLPPNAGEGRLKIFSRTEVVQDIIIDRVGIKLLQPAGK